MASTWNAAAGTGVLLESSPRQPGWGTIALAKRFLSLQTRQPGRLEPIPYLPVYRQSICKPDGGYLEPELVVCRQRGFCFRFGGFSERGKISRHSKQLLRRFYRLWRLCSQAGETGRDCSPARP